MTRLIQLIRNNQLVAIIGGVALFFVILIFIGDGNEEILETTNGAKKVRTQTLVLTSTVTSTLTTSGSIVPKEYSIIRSLTPGTVQFLVPIGEKVFQGQSLYSLADTNLESNYFNSRINFDETESLTGQRILQVELSRSSAEARLSVAEKNLDATKLQAKENFSASESTALTTYNSSYNTLKQALTALATGSLHTGHAQYRFHSINAANFQLKENARAEFQSARALFAPLPITASADMLGDHLTIMLTALESGKVLLDSTTVLLQGALPQEDYVTTISQINQYQTLVNTAVTSIINAQNTLATTKIQNELLLVRAENDLTLAELDFRNADISLESARKTATIETTSARAQLDNAAYNFTNLNLPSPFSGSIISHFVSLGEQVTVGQQLVEIGNLDLVEVIVDIDAGLARALRRGDTVVLDEVYEGVISEIEPAGDIESGKVRVIIERDNIDGALVAGNVADATFTLTFSGEVLLVIPIKAAVIEETESFVYIVEGGIATKRRVTLGELYGNSVSVVSGLAEGDVLIIPEGVFISDGDAIISHDIRSDSRSISENVSGKESEIEKNGEE